MQEYRDVFARVAGIAADYRDSVAERPVAPSVGLAELREAFGGPPAGHGLPDKGLPAEEVVDQLVAAADPGLMGTAGPRYFGFVIGGSLPSAAAAEMLAAGWDQCAYNAVLSPAAVAAEEVAGGWLKELLGLPATASVGFVTGAQAANTVGLAAARHAVLADAGWDVEHDGLLGAPPLRIVLGRERHATVDRALRLLGLGTRLVEEVATDAHGAVDAHDLARVLDSGPRRPTILCLQAGNVNTGASDPFPAAIEAARRHGAWVHVDGAFGLWAAASPRTAHLVEGVADADSWGCDGHKWLNVPYDSGFAFCARPEVHAAAVSYTASYLAGSGGHGGWAAGDLALESSRHARGFATWAALRELGRDGVAELVDRCCALARRMAQRLAEGGAFIANDVVLNQVLAAFGDVSLGDVGFDEPERMDRLIAAIQRSGVLWLGGTTWQGRRLMRISISNWTTTEADVDRAAAEILRLAGEVL
jgi:glutamate/tyrosine decarboxylase-like PLP-dependent enzyme